DHRGCAHGAGHAGPVEGRPGRCPVHLFARQSTARSAGGARAMRLTMAVAVGMILVAGCKKAPPAPVYETIPVDRRDIIVSAHATGTIQADTTVEVKTRASGEVLQLKVETGQVVKRNALLMQIDPRLTRNAVAQSEAALEAARVQLH